MTTGTDCQRASGCAAVAPSCIISSGVIIPETNTLISIHARGELPDYDSSIVDFHYQF